jgi:hypothetical protein
MGIVGWAAAGLAGWVAVSLPVGLVVGRLLHGVSDHYPTERAADRKDVPPCDGQADAQVNRTTSPRGLTAKASLHATLLSQSEVE